jgi:hypothetical protein
MGTVERPFPGCVGLHPVPVNPICHIFVLHPCSHDPQIGAALFTPLYLPFCHMGEILQHHFDALVIQKAMKFLLFITL